ncbi:MAG: haloacid dehalogenase-like hydrolase [Rhodoferax sp.]|nr:haloacid dehalogenase-like hydrolase [Rhodoferax sp.]
MTPPFRSGGASVQDASLPSWPQPARGRLQALIRQHRRSGALAVFDADNTLYQHDLLGALLPYLERKGVLQRERLSPVLRIVPFRDVPGEDESLHAYYQRLCDLDDQISYPWASQVFSGLTLRELKGHLDAMMESGAPIPVRSWAGEGLVDDTVLPPKLLRGQQELLTALMQHDIEVFVVSAASEELVRMVVSDPRYGYQVKPENVIGVSLLLNDPVSGGVTTARKEIAAGRYQPHTLLDHRMTPALWAPLPWYEGKQAAIHTYVHPWKKPVLVAGDTPRSDGPMFVRGTDVERGGLRLFIARDPRHHDQMLEVQDHHAWHQTQQGVAVTAKANWVVVTPEQIG